MKLVKEKYTTLKILEKQKYIKLIKDKFERKLAKALELTRVSAPLFVTRESGLQDDLSGTERRVSFDILKDGKIFLVYFIMGVGFLSGVFLFSKGVEALLNKARAGFFFVITGISVGSIISVFIGNDCVDIYKSWVYPSFIFELICGIVILLCAFILSYLFTTTQERKEALNNQEKK